MRHHVGRVEAVDRDRDRAERVDRPEGDDPVGRVAKAERDALALGDAEGLEEACELADAGVGLGVCEPVLLVDEVVPGAVDLE